MRGGRDRPNCSQPKQQSSQAGRHPAGCLAAAGVLLVVGAPERHTTEMSTDAEAEPLKGKESQNAETKTLQADGVRLCPSPHLVSECSGYSAAWLCS